MATSAPVLVKRSARQVALSIQIITTCDLRVCSLFFSHYCSKQQFNGCAKNYLVNKIACFRSLVSCHSVILFFFSSSFLLTSWYLDELGDVSFVNLLQFFSSFSFLLTSWYLEELGDVGFYLKVWSYCGRFHDHLIRFQPYFTIVDFFKVWLKYNAELTKYGSNFDFIYKVAWNLMKKILKFSNRYRRAGTSVQRNEKEELCVVAGT